MPTWKELFTKRQKKPSPVVKLVKCQYDLLCPNTGTVPIPVGSEIKWFCQPHAVQFRTDAVASYVRSTRPNTLQLPLPKQKDKAKEATKQMPEVLIQQKLNSQVKAEQAEIANLKAAEPQLTQVPYVENGSDIESVAPAAIQPQSIRTQLKYKNAILAAITVKDSSGRREAIIIRRIPPQLEKISVKRLQRSYAVDLERAYLVLGGMRLIIWDMYNPSPILFKEVEGPKGLTIEGELIDSRKLYTIADTATIEKLVTASSTKPAELNKMALVMIILAAFAGFFAGGSFGPHIGLSTCQTVATVTSTTTAHLAAPLASLVKIWLHI
jgi:hypothetical protein